jgi:hypothetical protein
MCSESPLDEASAADRPDPTISVRKEMMASEDKKVEANPAPKNEAAPKSTSEVAPKSTSGADPSKAEGGEAAAASPSNYSRGEGQKPVSRAYRENWNAIFAKKKRR